MLLLHLVVVLLAAPALLVSGYLALLTLLSWRLRTPPRASSRVRFDVIVPAHDEEAGIARTVKNLAGLEWPAELYRIIVVADNCSDRTAERAEAAGAKVLVRQDRMRRGKGYALELAFAQMLSDRFADAAVVVDADTLASPNLLAAFAAHLELGAEAVQAEYAVLNKTASWRTRLMALAFALFHDVRSAGRERLGLSCGLRGNGMCFTLGALKRVPHSAFSIVEDVEYGIRLGEAGIRVHYASEAQVLGEMVSDGARSQSQRRRWEGGRLEMIRMHGLELIRKAIQRRDPILLDLALDVLVPPLSYIVAYTGIGTCATSMLVLGHLTPAPILAVWLVSWTFLGAYLLRGIQASGMGLKGLAALCWAPVYLVWKLLLLFAHKPSKSTEWVRTARETHSQATT